MSNSVCGVIMDQGFIDFYKKLISINSISSEIPEQDISNEKVIDFLDTYLSGKGFTTRKLPVKNARNKFNLIAKTGNGEGGVALCGHTDTVPCDREKWSSNPFELTERNDRFYGLGVIDMKGFFAFIYDALEHTDLTKLKKPLYVVATGDEETNISNPDAGINAIKIMHEVVRELIVLEEELKRRYREDLFMIPYPTSNIGKIAGGDAPNRICESCELLFDIRPIPGHGVNEMMALTREVLEPVLSRYPDNIDLFVPYEPTEPFGGKISADTVKYLEEVTGKKAVAVNYATEATYYQELSETVVLGPGSIDMAHQPDEYLNISEIEPAQKILRRIVEHYCIE